MKKKVIEFFKKELDIDVSKVKICVENLKDGIYGEYRHDMRNCVYISSELLRTKEFYSTLVHELTHVCQFEYNKSFTLNVELMKERFFNSKKKSPISILHIKKWDTMLEEELGRTPDYLEEQLELDARIAQVLFASYIDDIDELALRVVNVSDDYMVTGLFERINALRESDTKEILLKWFLAEKEEAEKDFNMLDEWREYEAYPTHSSVNKF